MHSFDLSLPITPVKKLENNKQDGTLRTQDTRICHDILEKLPN